MLLSMMGFTADFGHGDATIVDGDAAIAGYSITGIDTEIDKNLVDLLWINVDMAVFAFRNPYQPDIFADETPQHGKHLCNRRV